MEETIETKRREELINTLDNGIEALTIQSDQIVTLNAGLHSEIQSFSERIKRSYMQVIKNLLAGEEHAESNLEELTIQLSEKRVEFLNNAIDFGIKNITQKLNSPLWLGERNAYLEIVDKIRDDLKHVKSESGKRDENLKILSSNLKETIKLIDRLKGDEKRSRFRLPFQITLWGLPVIIGIWASGRLSFNQNMLILLILFVISAVAYIASKIKLQSRLNLFSRIVSYFRENSIKGIALIQIPILIGAMGFTLIGPINDAVVKDRMEINLGETPPLFQKGSEYDLPYSIFYDHKSPAVAAGVKIVVT